MIYVRDIQVKRVYAAERQVRDISSEWLGKGKAEPFFREIFSLSFPRVGKLKTPKFKVAAVSGNLGAIAAPGPSDWFVTVSGPSLFKSVLIHEAAHMVSRAIADDAGETKMAAHGPLFVATNLWIVKRLLGADQHKRLMGSYAEHGVVYTSPLIV